VLGQCGDDSPWSGPGWFDQAKLTAYRGSNLVLLRKWRPAEDALTHALGDLDSMRVKHRCTAQADLATALAHQQEVVEACHHAHDALDLAVEIEHLESLRRVRDVHRTLEPWKDHPDVRELGEHLLLVAL